MAITLAQLIYDAAVGKSERVNVSPQKITTEEEPGLFVCSPIYWLTDPLKSQFASVAASCIKYKFISDKEVEISILDGAFNAGKNLDNKSYFQGRVAINIKSEKHYSFKKIYLSLDKMNLMSPILKVHQGQSARIQVSERPLVHKHTQKNRLLKLPVMMVMRILLVGRLKFSVGTMAHPLLIGHR